MKILLLFIAILAVSFVTLQKENPLRNTKWETERGLEVFFTASDTVRLSLEGRLITAAQYKVKDSFLIWRDFTVSAASCDTSIRGTYVYTIKDSLLTFRAVSDRCDTRANVIQTLLLARQ